MDVYRHPSSMEPLLPKAQGGHLSELTCDIQRAAGRLTGQVHSPHVFQRVAGLVREMNCYYSNLIEGHKTIPRDIERALKRDFSADAGQRDNQQLGKRATASSPEACAISWWTWAGIPRPTLRHCPSS